ncbi:unnamed protein product [Paramecium octaurelia]|uniref:Uncharacterized protein n=1 Tax=Paramecium octaurelia TaxID=43137 RepID=A0A8S1V739_PAROT|nr:unnamed protein product [Paramecium octaurelia]
MNYQNVPKIVLHVIFQKGTIVQVIVMKTSHFGNQQMGFASYILIYKYACEVYTWDKRLLTFKFKTDTSNQYQQTVVKLFESNSNIFSQLTKLIKASYLQGTATSSVSKYYCDLEQNQKKIFFKSDIPMLVSTIKNSIKMLCSLIYLSKRETKCTLEVWFNSFNFINLILLHQSSFVNIMEYRNVKYQKDQAVYIQGSNRKNYKKMISS